MQRISIFGVIYLIIGLVVAGNRGYLVDLGNISHLVSALIAILLWPLALLGVSLRVTI